MGHIWLQSTQINQEMRQTKFFRLYTPTEISALLYWWIGRYCGIMVSEGNSLTNSDKNLNAFNDTHMACTMVDLQPGYEVMGTHSEWIQVSIHNRLKPLFISSSSKNMIVTRQGVYSARFLTSGPSRYIGLVICSDFFPADISIGSGKPCIHYRLQCTGRR